MEQNYKDIKKGIKRAEMDKAQFDISIFFATVFGIFAGIVAGLIAGAGWGFAVGIVVCIAIGLPAGSKYYETDEAKQ